MCGIAGLIKLDGAVVPEDIRMTRRMGSDQAHRGPDDEGLYHDHRAVLVHRRLSIIDLSASGHQPMCNEDGAIWITYNGEIYNYRELHEQLASRGHRFQSKSDTEILIHGYEEWGIDELLRRVRGMFAFGLYDARSDWRLILARDRLGIKPLYFHTAANGSLVAFASEVKPLLHSGIAPAERDPQALTGFLLFGSVPSPSTMSKSVRCLAPGHYLQIGPGGARMRQYWDLGYTSGREHSNGGKAVTAEISAQLEDAVTRHMVSDVPVGVFLSGGVDSAAVVTLATRSQLARLTTLTVIFDEHEFSEAQPARKIAERFQTEHHEIRVTSDIFINELPKIFAAIDQPSNDGVNSYFVSQAARQCGLKVVLSGLGGDEVFWGYKHYRWFSRQKSPRQWFSQFPGPVRSAAMHAAAACGHLQGREPWMRLAYLQPRLFDESLYFAVRGFFAPTQVARLTGLSHSEIDSSVRGALESLQAPASTRAADGNGFNYMEMKRYLHDQLLRDADSFSMANSIELRVPYLDHGIVEYLASIPSTMKIDRVMNKPLLVNAVSEPSVAALAQEKKKGFSFPMRDWMLRHSDHLREIALGADCMDRKAAGSFWKAFEKGRLHWSRAWAMVVLGGAR